MFVLGTLASPLALAEEYIARPITNVPFVVHNSGIKIGEHSARAYLWAEQDEYGEATVEGLHAITSFSEGFIAAASVAAPVAGALESRVAGASSAVIEQRVAGATSSGPGSSGAALGAADETVSVFHGSIDNGAAILEGGLSPARAPTFVSRDVAAAQDALLNHPNAIPGAGTIIESRVPASQFQSQLLPLERPYSGFYPYRLQSTEVTLRTSEHIELFNQFIHR